MIKNVIKPLAKNVLIPLELTAAASATDVGIHKKILGSGCLNSSSSAPDNNNTTTLIISNTEMNDIKAVKTLEISGLFLKGVTETAQNEVKEQEGGFLSTLLGTLGASLLGNILSGRGINGKGRGINRAGEGAIATRQGQGIVRAVYGKKKNNKMDF